MKMYKPVSIPMQTYLAIEEAVNLGLFSSKSKAVAECVEKHLKDVLNSRRIASDLTINHKTEVIEKEIVIKVRVEVENA